MAWQRAYRGYDDISVWNFDEGIVRDAYIRLKALSESKSCGYPQEIHDRCAGNETDAASMWKGFVSDMVYFLKYAHADGLKDWCDDKEKTDIEYIALYRISPYVIKHDKRAKKGRYYLMKYFYGLWD
jgi:hypothetical protein